MSIWWEGDPHRLALERAVVTANSNARFARAGNEIVFLESIVANGIVYDLRFTYPPDFPNSPIRVHLLRPSLPKSALIHRYVDGSLCLHGPGEWAPTHTGVWTRSRAIAWIGALVNFSRTGQWRPTPSR